MKTKLVQKSWTSKRKKPDAKTVKKQPEPTVKTAEKVEV